MKKVKLIGGLFIVLLSVSPWASADSDYPAYDFQPTIVYQDESVIKAAKKVAPSVAVPVNAEAPKAYSEETADEDLGLLIGALLLTGIVFVAYKKSDAGTTKRVASGGSTGVSKYLETSSGVQTPSGVEKYLQERG